jgi:hypothetical protein
LKWLCIAGNTSRLSLSTIEQRITACLVFEQESLKSGVRLAALRPLHYLYLSGTELERGEFKRDTPQGKVRFGLPLHVLRFYEV